MNNTSSIRAAMPAANKGKPAEVVVKLVFRASSSDGAYDQAFDLVEQLRTKVFSGELPPATADGSRCLRLEVGK